jgi:hypothetical protein
MTEHISPPSLPPARVNPPSDVTALTTAYTHACQGWQPQIPTPSDVMGTVEARACAVFLGVPDNTFSVGVTVGVMAVIAAFGVFSIARGIWRWWFALQRYRLTRPSTTAHWSGL